MGRVPSTLNMAGRIMLLLSAALIDDYAGVCRRFLADASTPIVNPGMLSGMKRLASSMSSFDPKMASCDTKILSTTRSTWALPDEPCHQKLPFDLWVLMKAEGTANDTDAQHLLSDCLQMRDINLLELITPQDWDSTLVGGAPGQIIGETKHTATYMYRDPEDFEAMCADDQVTAVHRVDASLSTSFRSGKSRRLQLTTSEAGVAHQVEELISGLENLGCARTRGEDQTLCIMSDSFNRGGNAPLLQFYGDLPPYIDVVKELPTSFTQYLDEGSAMMELTFDIASGANYKFNTAVIGEQAFADDIDTLATEEGCDVIVDDISYYFAPGYRDGVVANAVDDAVEAGSLYFSSAGNFGRGAPITANFECTTVFGVDQEGMCSSGIPAHVFDESETGSMRYLLLIPAALTDRDTTLILQWDDDDGFARTIEWGLFVYDPSLDSFSYEEGWNEPGRATSLITLPATQTLSYYLAIFQWDSVIEPIDMRIFTRDNDEFINPVLSGGTIYGQACASKAIAVAAMDWEVATGASGAFADPETASVTGYSSRGPCFVDSGSGLETRAQPVTTAATGLTTSTPGFDDFHGTSASAPVAAAIATLIRAACSEDRVVTYDDIMEMLTDYDFTIDVTSDAGGAVETFGIEAGFGIISAEQMLAWVEANCPASCSG